MKFRPFLLILFLSSFTVLSCGIILNHGFINREEFLSFRAIKIMKCNDMEYCPSNETIKRWKNDRLGLIGYRKQIFLQNVNFFKSGGMVGSSYNCINSLFGIPNDKLWSPKYDTTFTYQLYHSEDSLILLFLHYNTYFDKIVNSDLVIDLKESPHETEICNAEVYREIDSILNRKYSYDLASRLKNEEIIRLCSIIERDTIMFVGESVKCVECYFGLPDCYRLRFSNGVWGKKESFTVIFKDHSCWLELILDLSPNGSKVNTITKTRKVFGCG